MTLKANELTRCTLGATDGDVGTVHDLLIEGDDWHVRYLVADTRKWLPGRKVLIAPESIAGEPDWDNRRLPVDLTRAQIERGPEIDPLKPISRAQETELRDHFNWPLYWAGGGLGPNAVVETIRTKQPAPKKHSPLTAPGSESHLHRADAMIGYEVRAADGEVGRLSDFAIDPDGWTVRALVVDTGRWLPGRKVRVSPDHVERIDWGRQRMMLAVARELLEGADDAAVAS